MKKQYDAIVVGAGPNGLAAAIELARAGKRICVYEANTQVGGGAQSLALTLPGFVHDVCSAVHPLAVSSPFFAKLPLADYGLDFINPPAAVAHPFDDGSAILLHRSVEQTSRQLGEDCSRYQKLLQPFVDNWDKLSRDLLGPFGIPRHPFILGRFGFYAIRSAQTLCTTFFKEERTRAFWAGLAAHSCLRLDYLGTAAFGLVLGILGHNAGWPIPRGGAQTISDALSAYLIHLGGEIVTGVQVKSLQELPPSRCVVLDLTPRQVLQLVGERFPAGFRNKLKNYRYGPGAFKMDWALKGPVPWLASECKEAATVHLGCSFNEIINSERATWNNKTAERPFVLVCQPSVFDVSRAPEGKHTLWAYCHVPNGTNTDMTEPIENQIERFAPGFRDQILGRSSMSPVQLEAHNQNLIGGDINGGAQTLAQMFTRPTIRTYSTPNKNIYFCSSSTPPGGGVHGMCGYHAARAALRKSLRD